jgi:hypothetical protein
MVEIKNRGLVLTRFGDTSPEEIAEFRESYRLSHGKQLPAYDFWLEFDPSVVKRHRLQAFWTPDDEGREYPLPAILGFLHLYTVLAYEEGIKYETQHARELGATDKAILQTIELAFIRSGPRGMDAAWSGARPVLLQPVGKEAYEMEEAFPSGWQSDPGLFDCGCDPNLESLTSAEENRIRAWYLRFMGEIPPFVEFLSRMRPNLLKAYRIRLDTAMQGPLPVQMFAWLELQTAVATVHQGSIRDALGLARGLGLSEQEMTEAIGWGMLYGGPEAVSIAAKEFDRAPE